MNRLNQILLSIALATVPVAGAVFCCALWPARATLLAANAAIASGATSGQSVATKAATALDKLSGTLDSVNRLCPPPSARDIKPCGVLADFNRTLATLRGTAGQVEIAAIHENSQLATLDQQEATLFADTHAAITGFAGTTHAATDAMGAAQSSLLAFQPLLNAGTLAVGHADTSITTFNALLARPAWGQIADNGVLITSSGAHIMQTTDAVETKLSQCTLHPTFACNARSYTLFGAQVGGYVLGSLK